MMNTSSVVKVDKSKSVQVGTKGKIPYVLVGKDENELLTDAPDALTISIANGDLNNMPTVLCELAGIMPPDQRAYRILEQSMLRDGVLHPLIVAIIDGKVVLLDGHMRQDIIVKHGIQDFKIRFIAISSIEEARQWMIEHSNTYRQLNLFQRIEILLKQEPHLKKLAAENKKLAGKLKGDLSKSDKPFIPIDCLKIIAEQSKTSKQTVDDVRYILRHGKPNEKQECREGKTKIGTMRCIIRNRTESSPKWKNDHNAAHDDVNYDNPDDGKYLGQVINDDCINILKKMHLDGVDYIHLVVFSPPYFGAGKDYGPDYKEFATYDEYIFFLVEVIYRLQLLGPNGMRICINIAELTRKESKDTEDFQYPVAADLINKVHQLNREKDDCDLRLLGEFHWYKNSSGGKQTLGSFSPNKPVIRGDSEKILVFVKSQKHFDNIDENAIIEKCKNPEWLLTKDEYMKYTLQTWQIPVNTDKHRHPAKFHQEIPYRLIKLLSYPGQTICDCFCGSGNALVAAKRLGRNWIGVDQNPAYCQMSKDRLAELDKKEGVA